MGSILMNMNKLIHGDCLEVMRDLDEASIDLIYMDPPFNTGKKWIGKAGSFDDKFTSLDDYLDFMIIRLQECKRIMKEIASIYLHIDPSISHYLKVEMDKIFGIKNFRNEIAWCYSNIGVAPKRQFPRKHDILLFYSKSNKSKFNQISYSHWISGKDSKPCDWWIDILSFNGFMKPKDDKHLGYPTQKPLALLERIIKASSNSNDLILDPFVGSGTTCLAAKLLGRKYIGIDKSLDAIKLSQSRLDEILL